MSTKAQRRRSIKAGLLETLSERAASTDPIWPNFLDDPSGMTGMPEDEVASVQEEIRRELYDRACRLSW